MEELFDPHAEAFDAKMAQRKKRFRLIMLALSVVITAVIFWAVINYDAAPSVPLPLSITTSQALSNAPIAEGAPQSVRRDLVTGNLELTTTLIEQMAQQPGLQGWQREIQQGFSEALKSANALLGQGQLDSAQQILVLLQQDVNAFTEHWQSQHQQVRDAALTAIANRNVSAGSKFAVRLKDLGFATPQDAQIYEQARSLKTIVNLEQQLARAADLPAQRDILYRLLTIMPNDEQVMANTFAVEQKILSQVITKHLNNAQARLANRDYVSMHQSYQALRAFDAQHPALTTLADALLAAQASFSESSYIMHLQTAVKYDDWQLADALLAQAKTRFPSNPQIQSYVTDVERVLYYQERFTQYVEQLLNRPSAATNKDLIAHDMRASQLYLPSSRRLLELHQQLEWQLAHVDELVHVTIASDSQSTIVMRDKGGEVGTTWTPFRQKHIGLLPGAYQFAVHRIGYQSQVVDLTVDTQAKTFFLGAMTPL
jgi:hypothetical protein